MNNEMINNNKMIMILMIMINDIIEVMIMCNNDN